MSRTRKGSKGPGWEPWSNLRERQEERADSSMRDYRNTEANRQIDLDFEVGLKVDEALYCHHYGPCEACLARSDEEDESECQL